MSWSVIFACCAFYLLEISFLATQTEGSKMEFVSSPDVTTLGLTKELKLRCSLSNDMVTSTTEHGGAGDGPNTSCNCDNENQQRLQQRHQLSTEIQSPVAAQVTSILITKLSFRSHPVASMVAGQDPVGYTDLGESLRMEGSIESNLDKKAYLDLSWLRPDVRLEGEYQCQVNGLDDHGHPVTFIEHLKVKVMEPSMGQLFQRLWELEDANRKTQSELEVAMQKVSGLQDEMTSLSPAHSEDGEVTCGPSSSWSVGDTFVPVTPVRVHGHRNSLRSLQPVVFRHPYDSEPAVLISITSINLSSARFSSAVLNLTRFGFTIECSFWTTDMNNAGHMNVKWLSTVKGMNQTGYVNPWVNPEDPVKVYWY